MKICLINNLYQPFARGGAEKVVATMARGLIDSGHEVFIITTKPRGRNSDLMNKPADNPRIYYLNSLYYNLNKFPKFLRLVWHVWDMFNLVSYFKIKKILKQEKCSAVITNNLMGLGYLTGFGVRRLKIKQIHLVHDIQLIHPSGLLCFGQERLIESYFSRNYAGLSSQLFGSPPIVIFPSRWLLNMYLDKIFFVKSKRIVLPNPVVYAPNEEARRAGTGFKFLYLGQIEKHKGVNLLIQAYKKVKEKFPPSELIIAGAGSELESVKAEAGTEPGIKFLGRQDENKVKELLHSCHCLVMSTLCYENCPAVILEAFSAGLPVLAADLGGIRELLGENSGILFRPGNAIDLADKMEWAITHPGDLAEIAKDGRIKAASYRVENYIKEIEGLIK